MNTFEALKAVNIEKLSNSVSILDKNSPNYDSDLLNAYVDYNRYLYQEFNNRPIEECAAMLYMILNIDGDFLKKVFNPKHSKMVRSAMLLLTLAGSPPLDIKKDSLKSIQDQVFDIDYNGHGKSINNIHKKDALKTMTLDLEETLKRVDDDVIKETAEKDFVEFANKLDTVSDVFFDSSFNNPFPSTEEILINMFGSPLTRDNKELLSNIYNNILLKVDSLKSFDYNDLFSLNPTILSDIKGIYRHLNKESFDLIFAKDAPKEVVDGLIKDITKANEDDTQGLKWFYGEVSNRCERIKKFDRYLKKHNEEYNEYQKDKEFLYDNIVIKLIMGDTNIDPKLLENLGSQEAFLANYDELFKEFMTTNNKELQKALIVPLTVGLVEKQNQRYGLDVDVSLTTKVVNDNTMGSYIHGDNEMYINPLYLTYNDNYKDAFVIAANTVFHEMKHAKQMNEIHNSKELDYDLLLMSMDEYLHESELREGYYLLNYNDISFEKDAVKTALNDTLEFFNDYEIDKELIDKEKPTDNKYPLFLRKEKNERNEYYVPIVGKFMDSVNDMLDTFGTDYKVFVKDYISRIKNYTVVEQFFDIDKDGIKPKSEEYFNKKINEFEKMSDTSKKEKGLESIKLFMKSLKIGEELREINKITEDTITEESLLHNRM